ncbi:hypothetical protein [Undibacterium sp. TJN19]|uniref:hypothetical protein n=1 Tax=Undibacterium sp. TJN19 TaxID=3413055 RepID=UPI003BF3D0BC
MVFIADAAKMEEKHASLALIGDEVEFRLKAKPVKLQATRSEHEKNNNSREIFLHFPVAMP